MRLIVQGRNPLKGTYQPTGNSNEALTLIAASLLSPERSTLEGVPNTQAVRAMLEMAEELGTEAVWQGDNLSLQTPKIANRFAKHAALDRPVAMILLLAPILAARGYATLEWSGSIGRLHTHLTALRDLGFKVTVEGQTITISGSGWDEQAIILTETSVTATALICLLAAAMGRETQVYNAASEPHLRSLQGVLVQMGAQISGIGSNLLQIKGAGENGLSGAEQRIAPDYIEIASVAAISATLPGHVTLAPVIPSDLRIIEKVYDRLGIQLVFEEDRLHVPEQKHLMISSRQEDVDVEIDTAPWPGFPSDLIAVATVVATQVNGTTLIHEKLFNNRLLFVDKLKGMGAQIVLADPHRAIVIGPTPLHAEYMDTPDVRTGIALLGAALCAEGETIIDRAELILNNFEGGIQQLIALGAAIEVSSL